MSARAKVYVDIESNSKKATKGIGDYGLAAGVAAGLVAGLVHVGKEMVIECSNLAAAAEEVQSKFNVVFGDTAKDVQSWADIYSDSVGRSESDTLKFLGSIGDLLKPLGFGKDAVDGLSKTVVTLANDLGSFNDMPTERVMNDIQSAMVGNYEVTKKYGVVMNASIIKQEAMNSGIWNGKGALDAQAKAQTALNLFIKGTNDAQGDLLKTQDSATNVTLRLENAQKDLKIAYGEAINKGLTPMKAAIADVTKEWAEYIVKATAAKNLHDSLTGGNVGVLKDIENLSILNDELDDQLAMLKTLTDAKGNAGDNRLLEEQIVFQQDTVDALRAQIASVNELGNAQRKRSELEFKLLDTTMSKTKEQIQLELDAAIAEEKVAEKQAAQAQDTITRLNIQNDMLKEFADINQQVNGELIEGNGELEKEEALRVALNKLIDEGFTTQGNGWAYVLAAAKKHNIVLGEEEEVVEKKLIPLWLKREEVALSAFDSINKKHEEYLAEQAAAEQEAAEEYKALMQEKADAVLYFANIALDMFRSLDEYLDIAEEKELERIQNRLDAQIEASNILLDTLREKTAEELALEKFRRDERVAELEASLDEEDQLELAALLAKEKRIEELATAEAQAAADQLVIEEELAAAERQIAQDNAIREKALAKLNIIMSTAEAVMSQLAGPLGWVGAAAAGALGIVQLAVADSAPIPALATGGSFRTNGPGLFMAGEGAGEEDVTVTPVGGNNNNNSVSTLNIDGKQFRAWVQSELDNGKIRLPRRAIV